MSPLGETPNPTDAEISARVPEQDVAPWHCGIAATRGERESAFRLIYDAYTRAGLGKPNSAGMRVTPYHLLPTTTIFIATMDGGPEEGTVFSTVSLVIDGAFGLPLERVYETEVFQRRESGLKLAEVSCLADRRLDLRRFFPVFVALNRWMIQFAQAQAVDQVLVAVHPKHARFYTRNLGFEAIGGLTQYPTANNRPAVALSFDFHRNHRDTCAYFNHFFQDPISPQLLQPMPMNEAEMNFFGPMVDPAFTCELASDTMA